MSTTASSTTVSLESLSPKQERHTIVSFGNVRIRSHSITLGDHPDCSDGPPVALDWAFDDHSETMDLVEFDLCRRSCHCGAPKSSSAVRRRHLLTLRAGIDEAAMKEMEKEIHRIRKRRSISRFFSRFWRVQLAIQSAGTKLKQVFKKRNKS